VELKQWECLPKFSSARILFANVTLSYMSHIIGVLTCLLQNIACVASVSVWFGSKERSRDRILGFGRARNETRAKKWKWGEGEGKEGSFLPSFPPHPLAALLLTPFFAQCLTIVPRSLLLIRRETFATQAMQNKAYCKTHCWSRCKGCSAVLSLLERYS